MATACLLPHTPTATSTSLLIPKASTSKRFSSITSRKFQHPNNSITCKASSLNIDFDLYELLGIDNTSDQSQIKTAYRMLQKRCHPDVAGPAGHDMAIILNDVYSILSDPSSRLAYDKEQAKISELRGYTGKPLYSAWFGPESEERAVFVDEVKCIGCLKCALFAQKTFAIESVYGRARVVAQWADPEHKIQAAIETCPVDCISMVERSDLAALEYLMSKQPRGNVRVGGGNSAGARVANIFVDVKKFQAKFVDAMNKAANKETDFHRETRMSAIQAIRSISNWLYWQSPSESYLNLTHVTRKSIQPDIKKLREAVAARKQAWGSTTTTQRITSNNDEYWTPSIQALPATSNNSNSEAASEPPQDKEWKRTNDSNYSIRENNRRDRNPIAMGIPVVMAFIAAAIVRSQISQEAAGGVREHVGGSLALDIVNSSLLQYTLAGITWYFFGAVIVELIEVIGNRKE